MIGCFEKRVRLFKLLARSTESGQVFLTQFSGGLFSDNKEVSRNSEHVC